KGSGGCGPRSRGRSPRAVRGECHAGRRVPSNGSSWWSEVFHRPGSQPAVPGTDRVPGLRAGGVEPCGSGRAYERVLLASREVCGKTQRVDVLRSALALLVARVVADDHDPAVTADHPALV